MTLWFLVPLALAINGGKLQTRRIWFFARPRAELLVPECLSCGQFLAFVFVWNVPFFFSFPVQYPSLKSQLPLTSLYPLP